MGVNQWFAALLATVFTLLNLIGLRFLERRLLEKGYIHVSIEGCTPTAMSNVLAPFYATGDPS